MIRFRKEGSLVKPGVNVGLTKTPKVKSLNLQVRIKNTVIGARVAYYPDGIKNGDQVIHKPKSFKVYPQFTNYSLPKLK